MSELIRNEQKRKEEIKRIIRSIDSGNDVASAKSSFSRILKEISPEEIAEVEQSLIAEGMPVDKVRTLCDLHVEAFESAISRKGVRKKLMPGHPVDTYRRENKEAKRHARSLQRTLKKLRRGTDDGSFSKQLETLKKILNHFTRKENQLFPYLERAGFSGPSQVMWAKHDEIREVFREVQASYLRGDLNIAVDTSRNLINRIRRMIFVEERILFPTALRKLPESTWVEIRRGESEIGYAWITPGNLWDPSVVAFSHEPSKHDAADEGAKTVSLGVGELTYSQIDLLLKNLPVDVTFVDENDRVRFYSNSAERIFPRSPGIIGRSVQNCHPPNSVAVVERILESFKRREKNDAQFWLELGGRFIHIRYTPVYDTDDTYRGVIEVSQDVTDIKKLEGTRTLLDW